MTASALFSEDRCYRYWLLRRWGDGPVVAFCGLNPSTATETQDDPTVRRCIGFAQRWNFSGLLMLNLYAFRSTLPKRMWERHKHGYNIVGGEQNSIASMQRYIAHFEVKQIIAAWGADKLHRQQAFREAAWKLDCLKLNADGSPGHPLYLPYLAERQPWNYMSLEAPEIRQERIVNCANN
jgi:hypothetical protein